MSNMFNPNGFGGYGYPGFQQNQQPGVSYQYNTRPQARMTQPLTESEIKQLRSNGGTFDLNITPEDSLRAICTHKDRSQILLQDTGEGQSFCPICGEKFNLVYSDESQVQEAVSVILDVLQTIKTTYLDIPEETARNFFMVIPLLKKIPGLYKIAMSNFSQYDNTGMNAQNGSAFGFNALNAFASPAYGMGVGMPMGNMNPAFGQQPMAPNYGYAQPMNNMGYQQPFQQMGYNPNGNPFVADQQNCQQPPQAQQSTPQQPAQNQTQSGNNQQQSGDVVKTQRVFNV